MNRFYVTTPIYYVNDIPHIGHAYTTIAADILARFHRLRGRNVFFLTGTDEHGQKVEKAAQENNRTPKEHADQMVQNFKNLWKKLNVSNDAFIRTTDDEHVKTVQGIIQMLWDRGEIERRQYTGWYCTPDERFWTEKEIKDGNCPDCGRPVEHIEEENYFFRMSQYQKDLISYIEKNPQYILPETRRNEVLGFLKTNILGDLCISRPKSRLSWGIPIPFDEDFVTYVWFDALLNYFSATRYLIPGAEQAKLGDFWWPASHHIIGKDILTTHSVYWSTMLMSLKFPLPENIFAHGWWTVEGKKMSKSLGNVVDPNEMIERYGADAFRYFLFREVPFGLDGDFSEKALVNRVNTDLANDLGNLLSRFLTMADKYFRGVIEKPASYTTELKDFPRQCMYTSFGANDQSNWAHMHFSIILENIWNIVRSTNNYIAQTEPWKLAKDKPDELRDVLFEVWNALRLTSVFLYPFMPLTAENMWVQLGLGADKRSLEQEVSNDWKKTLAKDGKAKTSEIFHWEWMPDYPVKIKKAEQLFPRIDIKKENRVTENPAAPEGKSNVITINELARIELKIGKVLSAERIKGSDKLIKLQVDTGEMRQIVAGIGKAYTPEDLTGKKIAVVTNLQPAKLMGAESQGMLLVANDSDGKMSILMPDKDIKEGSKIK
jgi:methionyl-tRNA synthetase